MGNLPYMSVQDDPNTATISSTQTRPELNATGSFNTAKSANKITYQQRAAQGIGYFSPQQLGYETTYEQVGRSNPQIGPANKLNPQNPDISAMFFEPPIAEQKVTIQPGQIYTAERQDPKPLNRDTWRIDWTGGIMAGILAVGSLAFDTAKEWGKQGAQYAAKQISTGAKQLGNSLDMSAMMGFKPASKDQAPTQTIYSTPDQHLKVAAYGTAEVTKPEGQTRNLTDTRNKLQKLMQEGKHAQAMLQRDDRRISEAQQAIHDVKIATQFRTARKISKQELAELPKSDHDVLAILAIRDQQRNGGKQAMPELQEMSSAPPKGVFGKAKQKAKGFFNSIADRANKKSGGQEVGNAVGS